MGILCFPFGFIYHTFRIYIFFPEVFTDIGNCRFVCFIGNTEGVGTDIGNQTHIAFPFYMNAFIQLLGNEHGFLCCHVQMLAGFLLHGTGGKRRNGFLLACTFFHFFDDEILSFQTVFHFLNHLCIGQFHFFTALAVKSGFKSFLFSVGQLCTNGPVFVRNEAANFVFSVADQTQCNRLHTTAAETFFDFLP